MFTLLSVTKNAMNRSSIIKKFDDERSVRSGNIQPPVMLQLKNTHHTAARIMDAASALHRCTNFKSTRESQGTLCQEDDQKRNEACPDLHL